MTTIYGVEALNEEVVAVDWDSKANFWLSYSQFFHWSPKAKRRLREVE